VFRVYLPATPQPAHPLAADANDLDAVARGDEMILIVEDEVRVATTIAAIVQDYGYRTLLASDARSALTSRP